MSSIMVARTTIAVLALLGPAAAQPLVRASSSTSSSRTSPPSGCISVQVDASGPDEYSSLSSAVASLEGTAEACIFVYGGSYEEQVTIDYDGPLTIYGYTTDTSSYAKNAVTITHSVNSSYAGSLDASSTLNIKSSNFSMYNINVTNGFGQGAQAVAATANGDYQGYYGCAFDSYQDTLYAKAGSQFYSRCYIAGAVDYIFGDAAAWFEECTVASKGGGSITASSRETSDDDSRYVFNDCTVQAATDAVEDLVGKVYLGRPWRVLARVMYQYSSLSNIINAQGWTTMAASATPVYMEYQNTGEGSDTSGRLYETSASGPALMSWLFSSQEWIDSSYPAITNSSSSTNTTTSSSTTQDSSSSGPTCTPAAGGSTTIDDTPAIASAIAACPSGTILLPSGTEYHLNTALSLENCTGCTLALEGTLTASTDLTYWSTQDAMITLSGVSGATLTSTTGKGVFNGSGQAAWDAFAADTSLSRPTMLLITDASSGVLVSGLTFLDAPNVFHSCNGDSTDVRYEDVTLHAVSASANAAKNTDGWDVGPAARVSIVRASVTNDDDCVAFKPGASYVTVEDITCTGSHGLSVGSLGSSGEDVVENVYVSGATMVSSTKAAGIKLYPGGDKYGTSSVSNVTYENIVVKDCDYAFQVQSCYGSDDTYCSEYPSAATLTDIVVKGISGTTTSETAMNINCPAGGTCGITMSNITVEGTGGTEYLCANTPSDIGITCTDGASG